MIFVPQLAEKVRLRHKWQTRRLVTAHTSLVNGTGEGIRKMWPTLELDRAWVDPGPSPVSNPGPYLKVPRPVDDTVHRVYSRIYPGDLIYVREEWAAMKGYDELRASHIPRDSTIFLKAKIPEGKHLAQGKWRPGMHMPRWASQTRLRVTELRAQQIQAIECADIRAEGVACPEHDFASGFCVRECPELRAAFAKLWDEINAERAPFASNPWVWCYTLDLIGPSSEAV